jgi:hypothetical protein
MGKANIKAGATQVEQDMAAVANAEATAAATTVAVVTETTTAEQSGVVETSKTESDQQEQPVAESQEQPASVPDIVVTPIVQVAPAAPVVEKIVVVEATKPVTGNVSTNEQLIAILKDVPDGYRIDINRIQAYLVRMAPKRPIDVVAGVGEQVALYRSIQNIINRQEEYFTQLFTALLFIFKTEGVSGALSDRYRMRFMDNITLHLGDRKAFANLSQTLHILADTKSRALAMSQINLERALENGLTAEGRKRVLDYFGA